MSVIDEIMALTVRLEACIDSADWVAATALDVQRCELIARQLNQLGDGPGRATLAPMLTELLARNELAMRKIQVMRELVMDESAELKSAQTAARAYVSHTAERLLRFD